MNTHCPCCGKPTDNTGAICWDCNCWVYCHTPCHAKYCVNHQWKQWEEHRDGCQANLAWTRITGGST